MTTQKTIPSVPIGALHTKQQFKEAKAKVWFLGLRLWMWKYQPHLRVRPQWPKVKYKNEIENFDPFEIKYKNVKFIPVWDIAQTKIAFYYLYTKEGYWLGRITHLKYIEEANEIHRNGCNRERL